MFNKIKKILGNKEGLSENDILNNIVSQVNDKEALYTSLSDVELKNMTNVFKDRLNNNETLDDILVDAFAVVRETSKRVLGMRHYDVQIMGGYVLHTGAIAEMQTGEGKTLVATLAAYLNALVMPVHIVTVNDYLAERDANWMKPIYEFLGLSIDFIISTTPMDERKNKYACDILYATNSEVAFDYLRNNMVTHITHLFMPKLGFAIIDEADSILIDEARNPIRINRPSHRPVDVYSQLVSIAEQLEKDKDYSIDYKQYHLNLTDEGIDKIQELLNIENIYESDNIQTLYRVQSAVFAKELLIKDRDYIVKDNKLILIDQNTGRLMYGRTLGDGYQQCVEAKEGLELSPEDEIRALTTYQKFFPNYQKLSGMTGTAKTEEAELMSTYGLSVVSIPTNQPVTRIDLPHVIYKTENAKNNAIVEDIISQHSTGRPVLVGTPSVEKSETISKLLEEKGIPHEVLNAKNHKREAEIIAKAGQMNAITIITNMAGRGTDIKLGDGVNELGGLYVIGTTRHESRRIDNQLRGRAGRQGDAGTTIYYVSMEDEILSRFGGSEVISTLNKMKFPDDKPINHPLTNRLVEEIQLRCESSFADVRAYIKKYDEIDDTQRKILYKMRTEFIAMGSINVKNKVCSLFEEVAKMIVNAYSNDNETKIIDFNGMLEEANSFLFEEDHFTAEMFPTEILPNEFVEVFVDRAIKIYERKEKRFADSYVNNLVRTVCLDIIDKLWIEHLLNIDYLKRGLTYKLVGGKDPFMSYTEDSFQIFEEMLTDIKLEIVANVLKLEIRIEG